MPPSLSRTSLSALNRHVCPSASTPIRSFSTTPSLALLGPESPGFIEIPKPPQHQARPKLDVKGIIPPPRNIFPRRAGDKTSPQYLAAVTPEPTSQSEPANEFVAWKRRMAASRRTNLREGLVELYKRKKVHDAIAAGVSKSKSKFREQALHAPQREDERLTNPTIKQANRILQSGPVPDPQREMRVAEKKARVRAKEQLRQEERRDALHTLYMNARNFITTEEQLDAKIEEIFVRDPHAPHNLDDNIWNVLKAPPTVMDLLSVVNGTQKTIVKFHEPPSARTGIRMKKIAEELTGGKME
ncbi:uncharacterized protein L3040_005117 [Drepanopeziza brunnea f. sp. 'multigermtubi']|uniref:Uncharacterized protein n=1 Tax=Marssonina brunnea f. sp. multigermtubi (strain MB_m1) TaxID=1072389 RepID=K1XMD4_MARBU|nr:uncharacterized protein MBM_08347 [Drepanopeziza brunnea f. sp. 'multigermtubi' MB_m1]EKD13629.1 hypothetical protein MBM_08347 [Drepanopeziza brunnea f. sp. 'multigermtubi' MB_m1]KAJ5041534.1 hypothetical protein L3040_005117 [Drepanopeziza brunnea f. sp. 'multigermtubi']